MTIIDVLKTKLFNRDSSSPQSTTFNDNMNYMLFDGEGIYEPTKRKRQIHIESFSEQEAINELVSTGYIQDTISIHRVPFPAPSKEQLSAMRRYHDKIPKKACKIDISFLISKFMDGERNADKELMDFATSKKVKFSYYTGEKSLYSCIWHNFSLEEKFAFYLLCVQKDKTGQWKFDLFEKYKDIAANYLNDSKFMNSFKRYSANGNTFYGFIKENGIEYGYSASRDTNCYKIAVSIVSVTFHTHARFGHNNTPMLQCQAVASVFLSDFGGRSRPYISAIF